MSSSFIVIPTGNKKKNRKWTNGEETQGTSDSVMVSKLD